MKIDDYYKDELLDVIDRLWTIEQIDAYIVALEARIKYTKEQLLALRNLRRRKSRNANLKDTGTRGGL